MQIFARNVRYCAKNIFFKKQNFKHFLDANRIPSNDVYIAFVDYCVKSNDFKKHLTDFLNFLQRYDLKLTIRAATKLVNLAKNKQFEANFANIDAR